MKRILFILTLVGMIVLIINSSFIYAGNTRGVTDDIIKIGLIMDQTGPGANVSVPLTNAVRNLIRYTNEQGGVHGRKMKLFVEDDRLSIPMAISAFKKLLFREKAFTIIGPTGTGAVTVLASHIEKEKIPFFSIPMSEVTVKPFKRYIFIPGDIYPHQMNVLIDYILKDLKPKDSRISLVFPDNETGKVDLKSAMDRFRLYNMKPTSKEVINWGTFDASSQVMNLKKARPDYILLCGGIPQPTIVLLRDMKKYGLSVPVFGTWASCAEEVIQMVGSGAGKFHALSHMSSWYDEYPGVKRMRETTLKYYPGTEKPYRGKVYTHGWVTAMVMMEGFKRVGRNLDEESFIEALEAIKNFDTGGLTCLISYSPTSHKGGDSWKIFKADPKSGKFIPITGWRKSK